MDVGREGFWTHLDGTEIANNGFTATFDTGQPNGLTGRNCAVVFGMSDPTPDKTHHRGCHSASIKDIFCFRNNLRGLSDQ